MAGKRATRTSQLPLGPFILLGTLVALALLRGAAPTSSGIRLDGAVARRACLEGARQGYRTARTELAESVPPHAADGVLAAYRTEGFKLAATARTVELVEQALRGEALAASL
jgi:hypothetical protein